MVTDCLWCSCLQALVEEKQKRERDFYNKLFRSDNSLNKQLKTSEEGTGSCAVLCALCAVSVVTVSISLLQLRTRVWHRTGRV